MPHLDHGRHFLVKVGDTRRRCISQLDRRQRSNLLLLQSHLQQCLRLFWIPLQTLRTIRSTEIWVVTWHTLWHDMVCRQHCSFPDVIGYRCFIDSQGECLANMDIVERFYQVIHGVVVNPQLRDLVEICTLLIGSESRDGYPRRINLACLIVMVSIIRLLVKWKDNFMQLRLGAIVDCVRNEINLFTTSIL